MRWLVALLLMGCGEEVRCTDSPLAGVATSCSHIEGTWRLVASDRRLRCGADTLDRAIKISSRGSELHGTVGGRELVGVHYASGAFALGSRDGHFSLKGTHTEVRGQPDELSGGVVYGGAGQECDALWDFTAHRE